MKRFAAVIVLVFAFAAVYSAAAVQDGAKTAGVVQQDVIQLRNLGARMLKQATEAPAPGGDDGGDDGADDAPAPGGDDGGDDGTDDDLAPGPVMSDDGADDGGDEIAPSTDNDDQGAHFQVASLAPVGIAAVASSLLLAALA